MTTRESLIIEASALGLTVHEDEQCVIIDGIARLVGGHEQDLWWFGRDATGIEDAIEKALTQVRRIASFEPCRGCCQRFDAGDLSNVFYHEHTGLALPILAERGVRIR